MRECGWAAASRAQPGWHGAFVPDALDEAALAREPHASAPLRLAVKDVFDLAGHRTGAGNPDWQADQPLAVTDALAVRLLRAAGAQVVGKTVTDELTYSLAGVNVHYGTPVNPAAPGRLPGGSSSGSAVAVAAGHADLALGTDCGGSVRLPASYCGLWGLRPSHGRIVTQGCFALAHSFDTVGWLAREFEPMQLAFEALTHSRLHESDARCSLLWSADLVGALEPATAQAFARTRQVLGEMSWDCQPVAEGVLDTQAWAQALRVLQAAEVWQQHGAWLQARRPLLGADVQARLDAARQVSPEAVAQAQAVRVRAATTLAALLAPGQLLLTPTVPGVAPALDANAGTIDDTRARSQRLLCLAGLAGLPQLSLPWQRLEGAPLGLSLIGARGCDEQVLSVGRALHAALAGV